MGKFSSEFRRTYWLSRFLEFMPDPPPKEKKYDELTEEEKAARYAHRTYFLLTGEKFDKAKFSDMMRPPEV